jgi:hypothetical protein
MALTSTIGETRSSLHPTSPTFASILPRRRIGLCVDRVHQHIATLANRLLPIRIGGTHDGALLATQVLVLRITIS